MDKLHREVEGFEGDHAIEVEELQAKLEDLEATSEENKEIAGLFTHILEDFRDVKRGVKTFEEVFDFWNNADVNS